MTQWSPGSAVDRRPPLQRSDSPSIAGVCGGLATYLGIDTIFVRLFFGLLVAFGGTGVLVYFGAWLLMPQGRTGPQTGLSGNRPAAPRSTLSLVLGGVLLGFALLLGLMTIAGFRAMTFGILVLLFAGVALLNRRGDAAKLLEAIAPQSSMEPPFGPPPLDAVPVPTGDGFQLPNLAIGDFLRPSELADRTEVMPQDTVIGETTARFDSPHDYSPVDRPADPLAESPPSESPPPDLLHEMAPTAAFVDFADGEPPPPVGPRPHWAVTRTAGETTLTEEGPQPNGPPLASITIAAIVAVLGIALVLNTLAGIFVGAVTVAGIAMAFTGIAIAGTAYRGQTFPLLPIAGILAVLLPISPSIDHALTDGTGSRQIAIESVDDLRSSYTLGVGDITLDLTKLELTEDTTVDVEVGTGAIEIWLPADLPTELQAETTVGYAWALGRERAGINSSLRVLPSATDDPDAPRLFINASVEVGGIDVYRG